MKKFKSHFAFDRGQRNGILLLLGLIFLILGQNIYFRKMIEPEEFDLSSAEIDVLRKEMDSLKRIKASESRGSTYKFNPNFISEHKAYALGLSAEEFLKLQAFRGKGKWINSVTDFQKVTGISDSLLKEISKDFKFPDWVTNRKSLARSNSNRYLSLPEPQKKDLNAAAAEDLRQVPGIGTVLSERIIGLRDRLGGYSNMDQLFAVYGLTAEVIDRIGMQFTVKTPVDLKRFNINSATASDIATLPGISFELAAKIWNFVRVREGIRDMDELTKIEEITPARLRLIRLYLFTD